MLPFLAEDMLRVIKSLLRRIFAIKAMSELSMPKDILDLNLDDKSQYLDKGNVDIGLATNKPLKDAKPSDLQKYKLRDDFRKLVLTITKKLLVKAPVKFKLVRLMSCLNPYIMATDPDMATTRFRDLLSLLVEACRLPLGEGDSLLSSWREVMDALASTPSLKSSFLDFKHSIQCLDDFLYTHLRPLNDQVWGLVKMLLLLSHGQASVERGFSYKELVCENLTEHSLVAQRPILDFIYLHNGAHNVPINKPLFNAARMGRQRYRFWLDAHTETKAEQEKRKKRQREEEDIEELKRKKIKLVREEKELWELAEKCADSTDCMDPRRIMEKWSNFRQQAKAKAARTKRPSR